MAHPLRFVAGNRELLLVLAQLMCRLAIAAGDAIFNVESSTPPLKAWTCSAEASEAGVWRVTGATGSAIWRNCTTDGSV